MLTLHDTAGSYVEHGGETRYLRPLIAYFSDLDVTTITPLAVRTAGTQLLPHVAPPRTPSPGHCSSRPRSGAWPLPTRSGADPHP